MTLRARPQAAAMQCTGYFKDKEEVALDEELKERQSGLAETFNQRLRDAATLKQRGNGLLADGKPEAALEAYLEGESSLEILEQASVILSGRMAESARVLRRDCRNNGAQAALKLREWDAAVELASAVLTGDGEQGNSKALFRRASAYTARAGDDDAARARQDLTKLLALEPGNGAARKLLASISITVGEKSTGD